MKTLRYYSRRGCHLCEIMLEELMTIVRGRANIDICDVDSNPEWLATFDHRVPVVELEGRIISEYPLDVDAVRQSLAEMPEKNGEIGILRR